MNHKIQLVNTLGSPITIKKIVFFALNYFYIQCHINMGQAKPPKRKGRLPSYDHKKIEHSGTDQ